MSSYIPLDSFLDNTLLTDLYKRGIVTSTFVRLNPSRREAIVAGILEEAAIKGPVSINIKEVARRAGVPVGSLYQYFIRRQGLLDFAIEIITRQMVTAFAYVKSYLLEMPLHDALVAYFMGGNEMAQEYRGYFQFFTRAAYQDNPILTKRVVEPVARVMMEMTRDILAAAQSRGEIRTDIDFEAMVRLVNTLMIAVYDAQFLPNLNTYYQLSDDNVTRERILINMVGLIEYALKK
jgi:AcrR family transcriptional regulator